MQYLETIEGSKYFDNVNVKYERLFAYFIVGGLDLECQKKSFHLRHVLKINMFDI